MSFGFGRILLIVFLILIPAVTLCFCYFNDYVEKDELNNPYNNVELDSHSISDELDNPKIEVSRKQDENIGLLYSEIEFSEEEQNFHINFLQKISKLAEEQSWAEFEDLLAKPFFENTDSLNFILIVAINNNADLFTIEGIINRGAELNFDVLKTLIFRNDVRLIEVLQNYGLDIHSTDNEGKTALYYSVITRNSPDVFEYFLSSGVDFRRSDGGVTNHDIRTKVLENCRSKYYPATYVEKILELDTNLDNEQRTLLDALLESKDSCLQTGSTIEYFKSLTT
jgi:hypothetical protein